MNNKLHSDKSNIVLVIHFILLSINFQNLQFLEYESLIIH